MENDEEDQKYFASYNGKVCIQSPKRWPVFIIGCIELGCSTISLVQLGIWLIKLMIPKDDRLSISVASILFIVSFISVIASWNLLESAYLRKGKHERFNLALSWMIVNSFILLLYVVFFIGILVMTGFAFYNYNLAQTLYIVGALLSFISKIIFTYVIFRFISELK